MAGPIQQSITSKLQAAFTPTELRVVNESDSHSGPPGRESHFRVLVVSGRFDGANRVGRHRSINKALQEELDAGLHSLAIEALTPEQWVAKRGRMAESPACGGTSED